MAFEKEDAAIFHGRDREIREGLDLLNRQRRFPGTRLALVVGASGSGKSSLLRAGILPRLERDARNWLLVDPFRPLDRPFDELSLVLAATFERGGGGPSREQIGRALAEARNWPQRRPHGLEDQLREFIETSASTARRRRNRRLVLTDAVIAILAVLLSMIVSASVQTARMREAWARAESAEDEAVALAQRARRREKQYQQRLEDLDKAEAGQGPAPPTLTANRSGPGKSPRSPAAGPSATPARPLRLLA